MTTARHIRRTITAAATIQVTITGRPRRPMTAARPAAEVSTDAILPFVRRSGLLADDVCD